MLPSLLPYLKIFVKAPTPPSTDTSSENTHSQDTPLEGPWDIAPPSPTRTLLSTLFRSNSSAKERYEAAYAHFEALLAKLHNDRFWPDQETRVRDGLLNNAEQ